MNGSPNKPSCGSTFKRPPGDFPGRVVEEAGLKGTRVGQIEVSPVHANYLVNLGGGTAEDALKLIDQVRQKVSEKLGIELEPEVRILGEPVGSRGSGLRLQEIVPERRQQRLLAPSSARVLGPKARRRARTLLS